MIRREADHAEMFKDLSVFVRMEEVEMEERVNG